MRISAETYRRHVRQLEAGQVLFQEGEPGREMYVIIEGEVEIRKKTSGSSTKTLSVLRAGDLFGEMALVDEKPRSASAVAVKATRLLVMNEGLLDAMIERNPDFARKLIRVLSERLRKANLLIQSALASSHQSQLLAGVQQFARECGTPSYRGARVSLARLSEWARTRLGIPEKEFEEILPILMHKGALRPSARGGDELIVPTP